MLLRGRGFIHRQGTARHHLVKFRVPIRKARGETFQTPERQFSLPKTQRGLCPSHGILGVSGLKLGNLDPPAKGRRHIPRLIYVGHQPRRLDIPVVGAESIHRPKHCRRELLISEGSLGTRQRQMELHKLEAFPSAEDQQG